VKASDQRAVSTALLGAYGFLMGTLKRQFAHAADVPASTRVMHDELCRGLSAMTTACAEHGRGAYARCGMCGRYSLAYWTSLSAPVCECGVSSAWSRSFPAPGPFASWAICLDRVDRVERSGSAEGGEHGAK
jgi:hypothetical protein